MDPSPISLIFYNVEKLLLFGVLAYGFHVALVRTSLLGFRLLSYFAIGQLALMACNWSLSFFARFVGMDGMISAAYVSSILNLTLYASLLVAFGLLMRNQRQCLA